MSDNDTDKRHAEINKKLRDTHVPLPERSSADVMEIIKAKIKADQAADVEERPYAGGGTLFNTYNEKRLAGICQQVVLNVIPDVTVTGDDPMVKASGKLGILGQDLHDDLFPSYVRYHFKALEDMDNFDELSDTALVLRHNCAMSFSPNPEGIYGVGTKVFDFVQFKKDMAYLGRNVDLNLLPICPIKNPKAFYSWLHMRKLSMSSDTLYTETNDQTDINDYYAAWSLYKSFKFHGGTDKNPHPDIAFAGCSWTVTRPTRELPALVMSSCRFDPLAFFFADRNDLLDKYKDIRKKRAEGNDPVPKEASNIAYTTDGDHSTIAPIGLTEESLAKSEASLQASGRIGSTNINAAMDYKDLPSMEAVAKKALADAQKVALHATVGDLFED